jgi:phosphoribosylformimino-5-aminoimidazole carboxamide ribotide isomerase
LAPVKELRASTAHRLFVAGGIRDDQEVAALDALGADAVVGMALYRGHLQSVVTP